jgi:hypothetical protein
MWVSAVSIIRRLVHGEPEDTIKALAPRVGVQHQGSWEIFPLEKWALEKVEIFHGKEKWARFSSSGKNFPVEKFPVVLGEARQCLR